MTSVTVGASGALAGLRGGTLSDIAIEYWSLHLDKVVIYFFKEYWFYILVF
jgi:hypothetical protein